MRQPGARRRERANASMARLASTPNPSFTRGPSSSSTRPVPVPISSSRPPLLSGTSVSNDASTAGAGRSSARISSQSAPWRWKLSEAMRARSANTRAPWRRSASSTGSSPGRRARSSRLSEPAFPIGTREPHIGAFAHPGEQPGLAQQLQVARDAGLALAEYLGELVTRTAPPAGEGQHSEPCRLGGGTEGGQQGFHGLIKT